MPKYNITAGQTIYATYEIEVEASCKEVAEKVALSTPLNKWDNECFENGNALTVDKIEEE